MKPLLITPGDPRGVGPEVVVKGIARRVALDGKGPWVLLGDREVLRQEAERYGLTVSSVASLDEAVLARGVPILDTTGRNEPVEVAAIRLAAWAALEGRAAGLVTGPIHKARLAAKGFAFSGHTDFLAHLCGAPRPVMAFVGGELRVALVTDHLPLSAVPAAVTAERVLHVAHTAVRALQEHLRIREPRVVVCGLDPHAGDEGAIGTHDLEVTVPAVRAARARGLDVVGPLGAEAAFMRAKSGKADLVVAMYHDQGLAPLKLVDFGRSVNWTLGLPIVRTSVDHGTADDIAGQGRADPASFLAALALAEQIVGYDPGGQSGTSSSEVS